MNHAYVEPVTSETLWMPLPTLGGGISPSSFSTATAVWRWGTRTEPGSGTLGCSHRDAAAAGAASGYAGPAGARRWRRRWKVQRWGAGCDLGTLLCGRMMGFLLYPWLSSVFPTEVLCWQALVSSRWVWRGRMWSKCHIEHPLGSHRFPCMSLLRWYWHYLFFFTAL